VEPCTYVRHYDTVTLSMEFDGNFSGTIPGTGDVLDFLEVESGFRFQVRPYPGSPGSIPSHPTHKSLWQ